MDVGLFMPQMGAMPPMNSKGALTEVGNGIYQGSIEVLMAWTWQTTVTARKNGAVIGVDVADHPGERSVTIPIDPVQRACQAKTDRQDAKQ